MIEMWGRIPLDDAALALIRVGRIHHTTAELVEHAADRVGRARDERARRLYARALEILQEGSA